MRQAWASGKFAHRRKAVRLDAWLPPHDALLRDLAGRYTPAEIAERLTASYDSVPRTETAVVIRMKRLGISRGVVDLSAWQMGRLFGVDAKTITHSWIARGWLSGDRIHDVPGGGWIFRPHHIETFLRDYRHVYDWRRMQPGRWRDQAERLDRADRYLTIPEAALLSGVKAGTISDYCRRGWIPCKRRMVQYGAQRGRYLLLRSVASRLRYRRPDLVGVSGKRRAA